MIFRSLPVWNEWNTLGLSVCQVSGWKSEEILIKHAGKQSAKDVSKAKEKQAKVSREVD